MSGDVEQYERQMESFNSSLDDDNEASIIINDDGGNSGHERTRSIEARSNEFDDTLESLKSLRQDLKNLGFYEADMRLIIQRAIDANHDGWPFFLDEDFKARYSGESPDEITNLKIIEQMMTLSDVLTGEDSFNGPDVEPKHKLLIPVEVSEKGPKYYSLRINTNSSLNLPDVRISEDLARIIREKRFANQITR